MARWMLASGPSVNRRDVGSWAKNRGKCQRHTQQTKAALRAHLAATDSGFDPCPPHSKAILAAFSVGAAEALRPLARFRSGHGYVSPAATSRQNRQPAS